MRIYTLQFMEQRIGMPCLTRISGPEGDTCFEALDDNASLAYVAEHLLQRVKNCVQAELSSMALIPDAAAAGGVRIVDDSLEHPHFHEMRVKFDPLSNKLELDFGSTTLAMAPAH